MSDKKWNDSLHFQKKEDMYILSPIYFTEGAADAAYEKLKQEAELLKDGRYIPQCVFMKTLGMRLSSIGIDDYIYSVDIPSGVKHSVKAEGGGTLYWYYRFDTIRVISGRPDLFNDYRPRREY